MKKSLYMLIMLMTIATANNTLHCLAPTAQKQLAHNDAQAIQLTKNIQTKMESAQNASTPAEKQRIQNELKNDIEQTTTYFDSVQNFFGYGPLAEKRRSQAEQQKATLEQKLFLEKKHFKTLHTDVDKEKSLKRQNKLANQLQTEKIALGQAWSLKQKALAAALASATAYVAYQYGGQAVSAAKKWLGEGIVQKPGEPTDAEMMAAYESFMPESQGRIEQLDLIPSTQAEAAVEIPGALTPEVSPEINLINNEPNWKYDFTNANAQTTQGWGEWMHDTSKDIAKRTTDLGFYLYNLLPSLSSTTTNE